MTTTFCASAASWKHMFLSVIISRERGWWSIQPLLPLVIIITTTRQFVVTSEEVWIGICWGVGIPFIENKKIRFNCWSPLLPLWSTCGVWMSGFLLNVYLPSSCMQKTLDSSFVFAFTMGSGSLFDPAICLRCEREFVAVYPYRWRCKQCNYNVVILL